MNSPIEPDSPASSASSDTQPGEETANIPSISIGPTVGSQTHAIFARATASTKRRLPSGAGHSTSARDSKSRRKENLGGSKKHPFVSDWVEGKASESRQKEDFIDGQLSEALKKSASFASSLPLYCSHMARVSPPSRLLTCVPRSLVQSSKTRSMTSSSSRPAEAMRVSLVHINAPCIYRCKCFADACRTAAPMTRASLIHIQVCRSCVNPCMYDTYAAEAKSIPKPVPHAGAPSPTDQQMRKPACALRLVLSRSSRQRAPICPMTA